ncbi:N1221-domain-containing protein [Ascodesmis nigricans]|uniref:N1221-domain-containing protein n=1 Tax=Ascodesmis nigricans TaxID=341454 RepID=A0A4S2N2A0_9PEZI|nr:N1221-domain-containing protein [Ascodesmis nigricans]
MPDDSYTNECSTIIPTAANTDRISPPSHNRPSQFALSSNPHLSRSLLLSATIPPQPPHRGPSNPPTLPLPAPPTITTTTASATPPAATSAPSASNSLAAPVVGRRRRSSSVRLEEHPLNPDNIGIHSKPAPKPGNTGSAAGSLATLSSSTSSSSASASASSASTALNKQKIGGGSSDSNGNGAKNSGGGGNTGISNNEIGAGAGAGETGDAGGGGKMQNSSTGANAGPGAGLRIDTSRAQQQQQQVQQGGDGGRGQNGDTTGSGQQGMGAQDMIQDSLSLQQLRRLVGEGGRIVQPEYAFEYRPSQDLETELNEWFSYSESELAMVIGGAKQTFEIIYTTLSLRPGQASPGRQSHWVTSKDVKRRRFISRCLDLMEHVDQAERIKGLEAISFIAQGVYGETRSEGEQMDWIKSNVPLLRETGAFEAVYNCLRKALAKEWEFAQQTTAAASGVIEAPDPNELLSEKAANRRELKQSMTILYFMLETTRLTSEEETPEDRIGFDTKLEAFRDQLAMLPGEGGFLGFLLRTISRVRWEENADLPLMHLLLLAWKATLLQFGSPETHLKRVKKFARVATGLSPEVDKSKITASPLDYHLFRQDLIAKYPAYDPPKSLFPFEMPSFLPSLTEREAVRTGGNNDVLLGGKGSIDNLVSIVERGVHIATPAPSPPPSPAPAAGGKTQKKHNYQTNNQFPFLYPPSEGEVVGAVGQPWWRAEEAGGVPTSIKEAGDLFSSRLRTTMAMKQLWNEKEAFEKSRRGWMVGEEERELEKEKWKVEDRVPRWEEKRLRGVQEVYQAALPQLQSLVIVMFKVMLQSIAVAPPPAPAPAPPPPQNTYAGDGESNGLSKMVVSDPAPNDGDVGASNSLRHSWSIFDRRRGGGGLGTIDEGGSTSWEQQQAQQQAEREAEEAKQWEEFDGVRNREIASKAVTGLLLMLLKWFRVSHILKFEYLTQLLLDSNYIPLLLKILNQQDVVAHLTAQSDHAERTYFRICNLHSLHPRPLNTPGSSSPDSACPPPILRHPNQSLNPRDSPPPPPQESLPSNPDSFDGGANGIPEMITLFSWRNFFTSTNLMRILQKVVKNKAHRNLALVQYKSSLLLRKALKCPQRQLRLYTLKVFKGQVPYCGRKWRQSNMRVITSIYLHCRPELRDDWLAGGDIDEEVEESVPQENALRALTMFYNTRRWPKEMGMEEKMREAEMDFFVRELEKLAFSAEVQEEEEGAEWEGVVYAG